LLQIVSFFQTQILQENHDNPISGHLGIDKTYELVNQHFFWPKIIKKYVSCELYQRNKGNNQKPAGLLQPLKTPKQYWEQISMDFMAQLPVTKAGHDAIVVFVNRLTKRVHFVPTHTTLTAPEVAKIFFNNIL